MYQSLGPRTPNVLFTFGKTTVDTKPIPCIRNRRSRTCAHNIEPRFFNVIATDTKLQRLDLPSILSLCQHSIKQIYKLLVPQRLMRPSARLLISYRRVARSVPSTLSPPHIVRRTPVVAHHRNPTCPQPKLLQHFSQSSTRTMASATTFYDFKPLDSTSPPPLSSLPLATKAPH